MPTGYTADIKDGISFATFAMTCARAFGACMDLRDEPMSVPIPEAFVASPYHAQQLAAHKEELAQLDAMTPAECDKAVSEAWHEAENRRLQRLDESHRQKAAYEAMLAKVNAWTPPTVEHEELKHFMRTQIEDSVEFDCSTSFYSKPAPQLTGEEWLKARLNDCRTQIAYHEKSLVQAVDSAQKRTAWVQTLRESLKE